MRYDSLNDLPAHLREQAAEQLNGRSPRPGSRAVTVQQVDARPKRKHKYNAKKVTIDGVTFDSKREARRYLELKQLSAAGEIHGLELQPQFELQEKFTDMHGKKHQAINYVADFRYVENGHIIIEDVKGVETAVFKIKKKLLLFKYGRQFIFRIVK